MGKDKAPKDTVVIRFEYTSNYDYAELPSKIKGYISKTYGKCNVIFTFPSISEGNPPPRTTCAFVLHFEDPQTANRVKQKYHGRVLFEIRMRNCWLENNQLYELNITEDDVFRAKRHPITFSASPSPLRDDKQAIAGSPWRRSPSPRRRSLSPQYRRRRSPSADGRRGLKEDIKREERSRRPASRDRGSSREEGRGRRRGTDVEGERTESRQRDTGIESGGSRTRSGAEQSGTDSRKPRKGQKGQKKGRSSSSSLERTERRQRKSETGSKTSEKSETGSTASQKSEIGSKPQTSQKDLTSRNRSRSPISRRINDSKQQVCPSSVCSNQSPSPSSQSIEKHKAPATIKSELPEKAPECQFSSTTPRPSTPQDKALQQLYRDETPPAELVEALSSGGGLTEWYRYMQDNPSAMQQYLEYCRQAAEQGHVPDHVTPSIDHVTAEAGHVTARPNHVTPSIDHVTTQADYVNMRPDHVISSIDHVTVQTDHVTREHSHMIAPQQISPPALSHPQDHVTYPTNQSRFDHVTVQTDHVTREHSHMIAPQQISPPALSHLQDHVTYLTNQTSNVSLHSDQLRQTQIDNNLRPIFQQPKLLLPPTHGSVGGMYANEPLSHQQPTHSLVRDAPLAHSYPSERRNVYPPQTSQLHNIGPELRNMSELDISPENTLPQTRARVAPQEDQFSIQVPLHKLTQQAPSTTLPSRPIFEPTTHDIRPSYEATRQAVRASDREDFNVSLQLDKITESMRDWLSEKTSPSQATSTAFQAPSRQPFQVPPVTNVLRPLFKTTGPAPETTEPLFVVHQHPSTKSAVARPLFQDNSLVNEATRPTFPHTTKLTKSFELPTFESQSATEQSFNVPDSSTDDIRPIFASSNPAFGPPTDTSRTSQLPGLSFGASRPSSEVAHLSFHTEISSQSTSSIYDSGRPTFGLERASFGATRPATEQAQPQGSNLLNLPTSEIAKMLASVRVGTNQGSKEQQEEQHMSQSIGLTAPSGVVSRQTGFVSGQAGQTSFEGHSRQSTLSGTPPDTLATPTENKTTPTKASKSVQSRGEVKRSGIRRRNNLRPRRAVEPKYHELRKSVFLEYKEQVNMLVLSSEAMIRINPSEKEAILKSLQTSVDKMTAKAEDMFWKLVESMSEEG